MLNTKSKIICTIVGAMIATTVLAGAYHVNGPMKGYIFGFVSASCEDQKNGKMNERLETGFPVLIEPCKYGGYEEHVQ